MNVLKSTSVECEYQRVMVKRSDLVKRIRDMVVIVKNYEDQELLSHIPMTTIPFYMVGMDDHMEQTIRSYFAEMLFVAALEYPGCDDMSLAGIRVGRLATKNKELVDWLADAPKFSNAERDFISYWCNPVLIGYDVHGESVLSSYGCGAYVNGIWEAQIVTGRFIKNRIDFDPLLHMIVYDHN